MLKKFDSKQTVAKCNRSTLEIVNVNEVQSFMKRVRLCSIRFWTGQKSYLGPWTNCEGVKWAKTNPAVWPDLPFPFSMASEPVRIDRADGRDT